MKTLLLVYVHGFKGGATTFADFPGHMEFQLKKLYKASDTAVKIATIVYPPYETKGNLEDSVRTFVTFLETAVIDYEVANGTHSPVVSPSVGVILVAHSMGGLVVSDATIEILARDANYVFPKVIGLLCFDSPFLGLHASVFAQDVLGRGAAKFKELQSASSAVPLTAAASYLFAKKSKEQPKREGEKVEEKKTNWGKIAGLAAAGIATTAAAAAGTAWYLKSQNVDLNWAQEHLVFVGAIFKKPAVLRERLWTLFQSRQRVQMIDYFTVIQPKEDSSNNSQQAGDVDPAQVAKGLGKLVSGEGDGKRTFCNIPKEVPYSEFYVPAENPQAQGEIEAHITMFEMGKNPKYRPMLMNCVERVSGWASGFLSSQ
ncbi:hypothetical protein BZA70DRAFT_277749 [Myxozyma melibiosi]|uniref:DUF676 domain-containing protein n=1 Tax=Myxozyma melibiosi TaxID=54550 RepID=A0ABR1F612_9ASCO